MPDSTLSSTFVVNNPQGLHMRPAHMLSELASQFDSRIELEKSGTRVDAKSVLSILTLNAAYGTELSLVVTGTDAEIAMNKISEFVESGFGVSDEETTEKRS